MLLLADPRNVTAVTLPFSGARVPGHCGHEGIRVAGRTQAPFEEVAKEIRAAGGVADTAQVDALDERAVDEHADAVAAKAGGIDIT